MATYQRGLAKVGPQTRFDPNDPNDPLGLLMPAPTEAEPVPNLSITTNPNTGNEVATLTIEQAITLTLANSPEIRVVSFDPEIARQQVTSAAGIFDPTVFSQINYEDQDSPVNSIYEPGRAETRLLESGLKQKSPLGTEWSASYALSRIWDNLSYRPLPTRDEPAVIFELKQPLLRDAWEQVNLAGVNVAKLNYEAALVSFRERAEEVARAVAVIYWQLVQARRDVQIQTELVQQTRETLQKVERRRDIDATDVQIKQAQAYALSRDATLLELQKRVVDVQDSLARLIADPRINTTTKVQIVPATEPRAPEKLPEMATATDRALTTAMRVNPAVQRAQLGIKVAEVNVEVAENQEMPRLDLVGSVRSRGLARDRFEANEQIEDGQYVSYSVGLSLEYPLGNRQRHAEWMRRKFEQRKAVATLHSTADDVALKVKESIRRVRTNLEEVKIEREAAEAARANLAALNEAEQVREQLTPEFMLVKLQAQETHAQALRAEVAALVGLNIAVTELAQATGTLLDMQTVKSSLTTVIDELPAEEEPQEAPKPRRLSPALPRSPSL